ncbi:MAG: LysR substrate-binding domain-containing protein [Steroidobacteraceae bacterium]
MTLRELLYLVAIADHRHFGRAAEACHVTQSTLSAQLRKLESYLGNTLVDRQGKQPVLTPIGAMVVERARHLLQEADSILALTRMRRGTLEGALNLGVMPTLAPYFLPWLIPAVRARYPKLQLVMHEDLTPNLVDKLSDKLLDAAFLALPAPVDKDSSECVALFDEPFFVACPPDHDIALQDSVSDERLSELKLLLLTDGHCLRGHALDICQQIGPVDDDDADFRATSLETLRQLVAAGMGCTLLPALAAHSGATGSLVVRPLASGASRRIGLVWRRGHERSEELKLLGTLLRERIPAGTRAAQ